MSVSFLTWLKRCLLGVLLILSGLVPVHAVDDINSGLLLYLPLDGNTQDASGNQHNANIVGKVSFVPGQHGKSGSFEGGYVDIPVTQDLKLANPQLTISTWVTIPDNNNSIYPFFSLANPSNTSYLGFPSISLSKESDGRISLAVTDSKYSTGYVPSVCYWYGWLISCIYPYSYVKSTFIYSKQGGSSIPKNEWIQVTATIDSVNKTVSLYINGELQQTANIGFDDVNMSTATALHLGSYPYQNTLRHSGLLDEVRIYNRVLTETEIKQLAIAIPFVNAGSDITVEVNDTVNFNGSFSDADKDGPYTYSWKFGDGNASEGSTESVGKIPTTYQYMAEGQYTATLEIKDKFGNIGSSQIKVNVMPTITNDPCDPSVITIRSNPPAAQNFLGLWNIPSFWDKMRVPNEKDWVLIRAGHTILLPNSNQIKVKGLCIEQNGVLHSAFNSSGPASSINLYVATLRNYGKIQGAPGVNSSVSNGGYKPATAGSSIKIYAGRFVNEATGIISANGRGGDDLLFNFYQNGAGVLDAFGGDGGSVEIYPTIFTNNGVIEGGDAGSADTFNSWDDFVYGSAYGGKGGTVKVFASNLAMSSNAASGKIKAGNGGYAEGIATWLRYILAVSSRSGDIVAYWTQGGKMYNIVGGQGGNVSVNLGNISGITQGGAGKVVNQTLIYPTHWFWVDPNTLKVDETTRFTDAENIVLFGGDDWVMDLTQLSPGAVNAGKTITLAVGKNGIIDLRGLKGKVFVASERVDIYADTIALDSGMSLKQLINAPELNVYPSKILRHVELSYTDQIVDKPATVVPVKLTVLNNSPVSDTYTIQLADKKGWKISSLPQQITVEGLRRTELNFEVTLPSIYGEENELAITTTSINDATTQAIAYIHLNVQPKEVINPRTPKADIAIIVENNYRLGGYIPVIANALETFLAKQFSDNGPTDKQVASFLAQFDEKTPLTTDALQTFLSQFHSTDATPSSSKPVIELISYANTPISQVTTRNIAEITGYMRSLPLQYTNNCVSNLIPVLQFALANLNANGQIFIATAGSPYADMTAMATQLRSKNVKTHVAVAGICKDEVVEKTLLQNFAVGTGGQFYWLPQDIFATDSTAKIFESILTTTLVEKGYTLPITLNNFFANLSKDRKKVTITWQTTAEIGNLGFNLYRAQKDAADNFTNVEQVNAVLIPSMGNEQTTNVYAYEDNGISSGKTYYYWLESIDHTGKNLKLKEIAQTESPLLAMTILKRFGAQVENGQVIVTWQTASETNSVGFNVWRANTLDGICTDKKLSEYQNVTRINNHLIDATASFSTGSSYTFEDNSTVENITYCYVLEEISHDGSGVFHLNFISTIVVN